MLLTIDVGNSNITIGLFEEEEIKGTFRMTTKIPRTSDEYGIFFLDLLNARKIGRKEIDAVIIASVVPDVMHSLTSGILKYFHVKPIIVGPGIKTGIKLSTENPREMGADRIVDAVAAYELYGGPVLVIDFGTATTHDLVLEDGSLVAGVTSPGIRISANALWNNAAKLPEIEISKPDSILAKNTVTSMQAGLIYGCIGQTEYIIRRMREEAGLSEMKVVATGGLGKIISNETDAIDIYDPDLTLKGLKRIYDKQGR
ncbi:MAG: type III pantothenate kinase [Lachnospiraceae bacterium]|nr:type III pantothenate kinase [Lachnospiraceae bacterium]